MRKITLISCAIAVVAIAAIIFSVHGRFQERTISFIVPTLQIPFFVDMTTAAEKEAKEINRSIRIQAPAQFTDIEQQVAIIENAVTLRSPAICLVAADSKGVIPALKKAQDANIPVILIDNTIDPAMAESFKVKVAAYVGSDNLLGGQLAAAFIGKKLGGKGAVAILEGVPGSDVANARKRGFEKGLSAFPDIRIVASQTANYSREQAVDVFAAMLLAHPDLDAVFAANDEMALGAIKALTNANRLTKTVVVGFDASADGMKAIADHALAATIQQQPMEMGKTAIKLAAQLIDGRGINSSEMIPVKLISEDSLR